MARPLSPLSVRLSLWEGVDAGLSVAVATQAAPFDDLGSGSGDIPTPGNHRRDRDVRLGLKLQILSHFRTLVPGQ